MTKPTNPEEAKQRIIEQFAGAESVTTEEQEEVKAEPEEQEEQVETPADETPAEESEEPAAEPEEKEEEQTEEEEPEEPAANPETQIEKLQTKLVTLHKKYQDQTQALKDAKEQNEESMQILDFHVESRMKELSNDQQKLVKELAQTGSALDTYKSLRLLDKHGVLSQKTEHKPSVTVDRTRVATEPESSARPSNPAEARKNIIRQLRTMKG